MILQRKTALKVLTMYGSSGINMLLGVTISIFNTRVLGTTGFGNLKFIESVVRLVASATTAGYFISITRLLAVNNNKEYERKMTGYFVVILLIMGAISSAIVFAFSLMYPLWFDNDSVPELRTFFFIVFPVLCNLALLELLKGLYRIYSLALLGTIPNVLYLCIAYPISLISDISLSSILSIQYGILLVWCTLVIANLKPRFDYGRSIRNQVAKENQTNGKPVYFGSLAGVATTHLAGLSISYFLDNTQVGFYMLALTICSPLLVIPSVLGTTFFKKFANIPEIPKNILLLSLAISIPSLLCFYFLVEDIIIYFYTDRFLVTAGIAKILIVAFLFHGMGDLINRFLGAKGQGRLLRNAAFIVGGINISGYTFLTYFFGMSGVITTRILASLSYLIVMIVFYKNYIKKNINVQE